MFYMNFLIRELVGSFSHSRLKAQWPASLKARLGAGFINAKAEDAIGREELLIKLHC